jgi:hypothetical protein
LGVSGEAMRTLEEAERELVIAKMRNAVLQKSYALLQKRVLFDQKQSDYIQSHGEITTKDYLADIHIIQEEIYVLESQERELLDALRKSCGGSLDAK